MRIERPRRRRSSVLPLACGCLAVFGILVAVVLVGGVLLLPNIISSVTGLTPKGETAEIFAEVTPQPTIILQNTAEPQQVTVDLGQFGQETLNNNQPQLYNFTVGAGVGGQPMATATFTEAGLMNICYQRSTICGPNSSDPRFRNARIDLRPGGAVVYVDATVPQLGNIPFPVGVVVQWDSAARRAKVTGVDIGGTLYTPTQQSLSDLVTTVEQQMNQMIQQAALQINGGRYTVSEVSIDDSSVTLILR
jgi:hypothetical protein